MQIKTSTAILLIVPTVLTCGIALFIYKAWNSSSSYSGKSYSSGTYPMDSFDNIGESYETKKTSSNNGVFLIMYDIMNMIGENKRGAVK